MGLLPQGAPLGGMAAMASDWTAPDPSLTLGCFRQKANKVRLSRLCSQPDDSAPAGLQGEASRLDF